MAKRVIRRAYQRLGAASLDFPLLSGDLADSGRLSLRTPAVLPVRTRPLVVGWLSTPPGAGSGGHTTMFRMIGALERAGHTCVLFLYDRHGGDFAQHERVIRSSWPGVAADVRNIQHGLEGIDACVATSWPSAHVLAARGSELHRFYFIQDYEPFFYPHGSNYELAADTYRFGFTNIALGHMVQDRLISELGVSSRFVPFSCDRSVYSLANSGDRSGVVFYAKPDVPRRGYILGILGLEEFHRRHPEQEIHVYGDPVPEISFPVTRHERLNPAALNGLYNRTIAGLAMSFTNISLVAEEMLACGNIPIVNDSADSRADLRNSRVMWAASSPGAIADALCEAVEATDIRAQAADAAASVRSDNWTDTGTALVSIVESMIYGPAPAC